MARLERIFEMRQYLPRVFIVPIVQDRVHVISLGSLDGLREKEIVHRAFYPRPFALLNRGDGLDLILQDQSPRHRRPLSAELRQIMSRRSTYINK